METPFRQCLTCGAEMDLVTGLCPACFPETVAPPDAPPPLSSVSPSDVGGAEAPVAPIASDVIVPVPPPPPSAALSVQQQAHLKQVWKALDHLERGELEQSLAILRAVLREDPDHEPAQAAVQEVRQAWLKRAETVAPPPAEAPASASPVPPIGASPAPHRPTSATFSTVQPRSQTARPRARHRGFWTAPLIVVGGIAGIGVVFLLTGRRAFAPAPTPVPLAPREEMPRGGNAGSPTDTLAGIDAELRATIEQTLSAYAGALEAADATRLQRARPDLTAEQRGSRLAPFRGASNATTDLRVVHVMIEGDDAVVSILRTDVIVTAPGASSDREPVDETLRLVRLQGRWMVRPTETAPTH